MLEIMIYVLVPTVILILIMGTTKYHIGSDHGFHLNTIQRIKIDKHKFKDDYLLSINEKFPFYPQLYHWLLSFLPLKVSREYFKYINLFIKIIEIAAFNIFFYYLYSKMGFGAINFLYANIVFNAFPFTYAFWNAKNSGLSARGIGLVIGQMYLYLLVAYILSSNLWLLLGIFTIIFIILLMSQMAMQFVLLSLPFIVIIFYIPELLPLPFIAYGLFYLLMPKIARNYIIGQYNHKRNYALFLADIFILKSRPSIYRDFIYDFWIKLKKDWRRGLLYMYYNPIIELIYGFIILWFVVYIGFTEGFSDNQNIMFKLVLISLFLFFITSFRWTRFLGEPQRYVEFTIPLISLLFVLNYGWHILLFATILSILIVLIPKIILGANINFQANTLEKDSLVSFIKKRQLRLGEICISNDSELLKSLSEIGYTICRPDYSVYYKTSKEYFQYYYTFNGGKISPFALQKYNEEFEPNLLIINTDIYSFDYLISNADFSKWQHIKQEGRFDVYLKYK